jgi:uncharacterized protein YeaO (DUF488 family)
VTERHQEGRLIMDEWLKEIAPSDKLRKWFSHDPKKYQEFKKRYTKELQDQPEILERIKSEARKGTVTILFCAKDTEHNNATALKELLNAQTKVPGEALRVP